MWGLGRPSDSAHGQQTILLLEPPAGQRVPYLDPQRTLEILWQGRGLDLLEAQGRARDLVASLKVSVSEDRWVCFFDGLNPDTPECLPATDFVSWLRSNTANVLGLGGDVADFLELASQASARVPIFHGPDNPCPPGPAWSLLTLPTLPPPTAMIEYMLGAPWADIDGWGEWQVTDNPFMQWRQAIRPVAQELQRSLGEPVYRFANLESGTDDDDVHRLLVLHWCCTWKPHSSFVRYLQRASGAENVEALKAALVDPASYRHPFKMNYSLRRLQAHPCLFEYVPSGMRRTVAVVFLTELAREGAQAALAQSIGAHALVVAPKDLASEDWLKQAAIGCRGWAADFVRDRSVEEPIALLAEIDKLYVINDGPVLQHRADLKLSESVEDLLWLAAEYGIDHEVFSAEGVRRSEPGPLLRQRGVPERVAAQRAQRAESMRKLTEVHVMCDFYSSGLWDARGRSLGYDLLDLPFPLVRRLARWQSDYDETFNPPDPPGDDAWWSRHRQEGLKIAKDLQAFLGPHTKVSIDGVVGGDAAECADPQSSCRSGPVSADWNEFMKMTNVRTWKPADLTKAFFPVEMRSLYMSADDDLTGYMPLRRHFAVVDVERQHAFAVVTDDYELVTNRAAYERAAEVMKKVFRTQQLADMECLNVTMPKSRSFCHIDLIHRTSTFSPWEQDKWSAFLRITNSYNRTRLLRFELGFCRWICLNGMIFGSKSIEFSYAHSRRGMDRVDRFVENIGDIRKLEESLSERLHQLKSFYLSEQEMLPLVCRVFGIEVDADVVGRKRRVQELLDLRKHVDRLTQAYFSEMGSNGYAALNVLTDFASRPTGVISPEASMHGLQQRVGSWMDDFVSAIKSPGFDIDEYLDSCRETASLIDSIQIAR